MISLGVAFRLLSSSPGHSGDTIAFQFLAEVVGVPHPPRAPFYVMILWVWRHLLAFVTPAFAANLLSFVAGILVLAGVWRLLNRWRVSGPAIFIGLMAVVSTRLWLTMTSVAEVHVPALAGIVGSLVFAQAWIDSRRDRNLLIAAACLALAVGIHPASILAVPCLLVILLGRGWHSLIRPGILGAVVVFMGILALAIAIVLLAATRPGTRFVWMEIVDAQSAIEFLTASHFGRVFGTFSLAELLTIRIPTYFDTVVPGSFWTWILWFGPLFVRWRDRRVGAAVALLLANACSVASNGVGDAGNLVLPGQVAMALLVALGVDGWEGLARRTDVERVARVVPLVAALSFAAQMIEFPAKVTAVDRVVSDREHVERARAAIRTAGSHSLIVSPNWGDSCALWYELFVEEHDDAAFAVSHAATIQELVAYVEEGAPLRAGGVREEITPGRDVFIVRQNYVQPCLDNGLFVYSLSPELHLIRARRDSTVSDRWPDLALTVHDPDGERIAYRSGWGVGEFWGRWMLAQEARLAIENAKGSGELRIAASLWDGAQPPIRVTVRQNGRDLSSFTVETPPWTPSDHFVHLVSDPNESPGEIDLVVDALHTADRDRPRALAVHQIEWRPDTPAARGPVD